MSNSLNSGRESPSKLKFPKTLPRAAAVIATRDQSLCFSSVSFRASSNSVLAFFVTSRLFVVLTQKTKVCGTEEVGQEKKTKKKHDEDHGGGKDERSLPRAVMERRTQPIMTGSLQQASGSRPFRPLHSSAFTHAHSTSLFPSLSVPPLAHVSHRWRIRRRHQNKNQGTKKRMKIKKIKSITLSDFTHYMN